MTYHYVELAHYIKFKADRLIALNRKGEDITPRTEDEQIRLWGAKVESYVIDKDNTMIVTLDR